MKESVLVLGYVLGALLRLVDVPPKTSGWGSTVAARIQAFLAELFVFFLLFFGLGGGRHAGDTASNLGRNTHEAAKHTYQTRGLGPRARGLASSLAWGSQFGVMECAA